MNRQGRSSALQKIGVECKTCGVSDSFYSNMSVSRFRLEHIGHEVSEGNTDTPTTVGLRTDPPNGRQYGEIGEKVRLLKVLVELVMLPAYPTPVFTITGVREDLKSAFVQVVSPSQRDQVRETLEKGKYLDSGAKDMVYVWEPKSVSFSQDASLAMSLGPSLSAGSNPIKPNPATEQAFRGDTPSTSRDVHEIQMAGSGAEQAALAIDEAAAQAEPVVFAAPPNPFDYAPSPPSHTFPQEATSPASAKANAAEADAAVAIPSAHPEARARPSLGSREVSTAERAAGKEGATARSSAGARDAGVEDDNYLLVSRSWYIEKGPKNMTEAVRISKLLRPFRWRIEPAYTIGVMVDDILSVESANGEIGGDVTKQIEGAGYKLSRVSVEKGKPVAWFKRVPASGRDAPGA